MLVVCYDISDDKLRLRLSKWLEKSGGIRLQYSVFEFSYSTRILENIKIRIESDFAKKFGGGDSVFIFETNKQKAIKYGNAIHRDQDLLYFT
ncbi:MAG: CRISPR-associated endonuclease Cas2 [Bacteroidetes bacterium HGW-Bacteroidetes-6]|jgi:CRISPR-associated protein Cas2|nr:MAG: CRISPR-associated endonuclease Cas2 [Bacteroidetes bacterium HGW-Bacteroidetes-6]